MSIGNPAAERAAIESTYEDTATILRAICETVGAVDRPVLRPVYELVPCALSRTSDKSKQTNAQQDIECDSVLFVAPGMDIQPGDRAEVTRFGGEYSFEVVGRPAVYATHQEVFLKERTLA